MNAHLEAWIETHLLTRRRLLALGVGAGSALALARTYASENSSATPMSAASPSGSEGQGFSVESESTVAQPYSKIHGGNGTISVRFFRFDKQAAPANFVIYDIPPGASEGVHTHHLGDSVLGPYDEYYYIIEGEGAMPIDGKSVPVKSGDHVHTPLGVAHGITNTKSAGNLRVFLTFIAR